MELFRGPEGRKRRKELLAEKNSEDADGIISYHIILLQLLAALTEGDNSFAESIVQVK